MWNISWEIHVSEEDANTPLDAAKYCQKIMRDDSSDWFFYVQDNDTKEIFFVDCEDNNKDAVQPITKYKPIIET